MVRKGAIRVLATFGPPCPQGYHANERFSTEIPAIGTFQCPAAEEAMQPYLDFMERHVSAEEMPPCRFVASCQCPVSPTEVVFSFYTFPSGRRTI